MAHQTKPTIRIIFWGLLIFLPSAVPNEKLSDRRRKGKVEREQYVRILAQHRAHLRGGGSSPAPCSTWFSYLRSSSLNSFSASRRVASDFASVRAFRRYDKAASPQLFRVWYGKLRGVRGPSRI